MRRAVLAAGAAVADGADARDAFADANRLRRMDRFGRSGLVAGGRALAAAGLGPATRGASPDARFGVVVGTAFGCRDAVTRHAALLATAAQVEDLAPSVFAATVHNAAAGELAALFGLGGVAETLVSGRTAGLEALAWAAARVARGDADRILVVGAEGIGEALHAAWERENPGRTLVESAAAVLVEGREEEEDSSSKRGTAVFVGAELTFEPAARRETSEENGGDVLERVSGGGAGGEGGAAMERLGASGLWEIAADLAAAAASAAEAHEEASELASAAGAPGPFLPSKKLRNRRYVVRDVHGSCAAVTLAFFS